MQITSLTPSVLALASGGTFNDNMQSILNGLAARGYAEGLERPERLCHYLAQIGHESMGFRYDRELWGPTAAQKRYDTRTDLGNTPERDGDGKKFAGHTAMQITGRYNTREFLNWCKSFGSPPDFMKNPELMNTDPWEGLGPIWYWQLHDLNKYADTNDIRGITRKINGGYNGYADRKERYVRCALLFLGYSKNSLRRYQHDKGLEMDGVAGPITRATLHKDLCNMPEILVHGSKPVTSNNPVSVVKAPHPIAQAFEKMSRFFSSFF